MNEFDSRFIEHEGVRLHYLSAGTGPLVLFYHGFPLFSYAFFLQMRALAKHYHVVAIDGPGINLSDKPKALKAYRLPSLVAQIDTLARTLHPNETFDLVGHDWGGALAFAFAQDRPERLKHIVSINAPAANQLIHLLLHNKDQQQRSRYMWSMRTGKTHDWMIGNNGHDLWQQAYSKFRGLPHYTERVDATFRQGLAQPGAIDGGINWYRANIPPLDQMTPTDAWPSATAQTPVPAMLIWGEDDDTFVPEFIDDLPRFASNLSVRRIAGVGHTPMLEVPDLVNRYLLEFLAC
jgi:pimeloyl-ACP methyl ester carboxylesterase